MLRLTGAGESQWHTPTRYGDLVKDLILLAPITEFRPGGGGSGLLLPSLPHDHEALGVFIRERPDEDAIDDTEDRGVATNAQREGEHGHRGKAGDLQ